MRARIAAVLAAASVAACAVNPFADVVPGTPRQDVIARLGQPTRVVPIVGGERLQYSYQPFGRATWMVDLDGAGRVVSARQVLNSREFARIVPGQWTREDMEREFGPPDHFEHVSSWDGPIATYQWRDLDGSLMFYYVYLDRAGVVQRAHPGIDFINAPDDRNR
ncbi:hypothetical protein [Ramlibacter humi]|uniref:Lipoprotein SmpA/OmlA domain-containing protein n=1 Tax=Ramlibacter humi TaxID=2530451 RepID=A0A4Z0BRT0_9BURK|nr:hypothetical protein [Ramlibacter humi]TFZ02017.1 hypothetical protein EZ216_12635 [Ramlibacter humi]